MGKLSRRKLNSRRVEGLLVAGPLVALSALVFLGCPKTEATPDKTCTGASALSMPHDRFIGTSLALKQLALTFDDGPGSRTLELSAYLKQEGIRAAFFINGQCFGVGNPCGNPSSATPASVFNQLIADGHIIGNHTQRHLDLVNQYTPANPTTNAAMLKDIVDTDTIIAPFVPAGRFLFRAPYGSWDKRAYDLLHASAMDKYFGPVRWDVGTQMSGDDTTGFAADWDCWQDNGNGTLSTKICADRYLNEITSVGKGIILFHDADYGSITVDTLTQNPGNSIAMVKHLVPLLKADGFTFVRLDEVPELAAALPPLPPEGSDAGADGGADGSTSGGNDASTTRPPTDPCPDAGVATQTFSGDHQRAPAAH